MQRIGRLEGEKRGLLSMRARSRTEEEKQYRKAAGDRKRHGSTEGLFGQKYRIL
jgi:hypothetical protein